MMLTIFHTGFIIVVDGKGEYMTNDMRKQLVAAGFTEKEVNTFLHQEAYRKEYNARPEVKEKRKAYSKTRNERYKMLRELVKG